MSYRGLTPYQVGLVASIATLSSIVPIVLIGNLSDMMNREKVQGIIGIGLAILIPLYTRLDSLPSFALMHSIYMILSYSYMTLSGAIAMDYIQTLRGSGFGRFRTSGALGWMLGTFLSGWIVEKANFPVIFYTSSIFFWTSAIMFSLGGLHRKSANEKNISKVRVEALKKIVSDSTIYSLLVAIFIASLTTPAYYTFLPLYITEELKASRFLSSLAFTITPIAEVPAMIYVGVLSDRISRKRIIAFCLVAYPIRYLLTVLTRNPILVIIVQLLHGLTFGGLYVVSIAYLSDSVPEDMKGLTLSFYTIFMNLGVFIGNYIMGFIVDRFGFDMMYFIAALISFLSLPTLIILSSRRR